MIWPNLKNNCPFAGRMGQCAPGECSHHVKRYCKRCGDVLRFEDDVICGYHHLENEGASSGGGFEQGRCVNCDEPLGSDGKCFQCDVPV